MVSMSLEEVYKRYVKVLTPLEQLRLVSWVTSDIAESQAGEINRPLREYDREAIDSFLSADQIDPDLISKVKRLLTG